MYGVHTYIAGANEGNEEYQTYIIGTKKLLGEKEVIFNYSAFGRNTQGAINSAIASNYHGFERSLHYMVMQGSKPDLLKDCSNGSLEFNLMSSSQKKNSDLETYIAISYSED